MKHRYHFARQRRQLQYATKQLERLHTAGLALPARLTLRFQDLVSRLSPRLGRGGLYRTLGTGIFLLGVCAPAGAQTTPTFLPPRVQAFGLDSTNAARAYYTHPVLADIDGDGDLDLFIGVPDQEGDNYATAYQFQENTGTPEVPEFSAPVINPFGLTAELSVYKTSLVDIDGDGDLDLFEQGFLYLEFGSTPASIFRENIGSSSEPLFSDIQTDPFGISGEQTEGNPTLLTFGDLDADGDMDIIGQSYDYLSSPGRVVNLYYENITGDDGGVTFAPPVDGPSNLDADVSYEVVECLVDIDEDGDLDVVGSSFYYGEEEEDGYGSLVLFEENTGTAQEPDFGILDTAAFGIELVPTLDRFSRFTCGDLDNDGDIDLLAISDLNGFLYFENSIISSTDNRLVELELTVSPNPTSGLLRIQTSEVLVKTEVSNALGQLVRTLGGNAREIDLSAVPAGVYTARFVRPDGTYGLRRMVKQ